MKKRILSLLTALCLCLSLLPTTAWAATGGEHSGHCICGAEHSDIGDHTSENVITEWTAVSGQDSINGTGNYYLTDDVTLDSKWTIANGTNITLCLNGHKLTSINVGENNWDTILVEGTLTITDCKGSGKITGTNTNSTDSHHKIIVVSTKYEGCTLNLYGGTITGINAGTGTGGGVHNEGTFNMYGGTITENKAGDGGGVDNYYNTYYRKPEGPGEFNFYGGTIKNNSSSNSSANDVYNRPDSTINANGGTIKNSVTNNGTITTKDDYDGTTFKGEVTNNSKGTIKGGIYKGTVTNKGTISDGTFNAEVTNVDTGTATIKGGTFNGSVTNNSRGVITGGTFNGTMAPLLAAPSIVTAPS